MSNFMQQLPHPPDGKTGWPWSATPKALPPLTSAGKPWPKISIVTPSYNQGQFLEETIRSVLLQGYPNLEYIIMDGGSTDNSVEIIRKYEQQLAYWVSEKDAGQYDAINKGFAKSTGEIMAWINSDDMYCLWALRTVGEVFADLPEVNWLTTLNPGLIDCAGNWLGFEGMPGYSKEAFLDGANLSVNGNSISWIQQESTFWRRPLWEQSGGISHDYSLAGDFDLWGRFYAHGKHFGLISPLAGFRVHENQKSMQLEKYCSQACLSLDKHRQDAGYSICIFKKWMLKARWRRTPLLRSLAYRLYPYQAFRVVRENNRVKESPWVIEDYCF